MSLKLPMDCWIKKAPYEARENVKGTIVRFFENTGNYLVVYSTLSGKAQAWFSLDELTFEKPECQDIKG